MSNLKKLKKEIYKLTLEQKETAWNLKYDDSCKLRKEEKKNYEKYKLLEGIIKAREKEEKNV